MRERQLNIRVTGTVVSPRGEEEERFSREVRLWPRGFAELVFPLHPRANGLFHVKVSARVNGWERVLEQEGTFAQLPKDTRRASTVQSRWGLWWWRGGHLTNPNEEECLYLLRAAGVRCATATEYRNRRIWGVVPRPLYVVRGPAKWAFADPYDPKEYSAFSESIGKKVAEMLKKEPDIPYFCLFAENALSTRLTFGIPAEYVGEPEFELTKKRKLACAHALLLPRQHPKVSVSSHQGQRLLSVGASRSSVFHS